METWALIAAVEVAAASSMVSLGICPLNLCLGLSLQLRPILSGVHLVFLMPLVWFQRLWAVICMATCVLTCRCSAPMGGAGLHGAGLGELAGV